MNIYVGNHVVPDEFRFFNGVILNLRKFINRVERVGVSDGGEFVHFGSGAFNIVNQHVELRFVDVSGDENFGSGFVDVVIAVVECLTGLDGLLYEFGS